MIFYIAFKKLLSNFVPELSNLSCLAIFRREE